MTRFHLVIASLALTGVAGVLLSMNACGGASSTLPPPGSQPIKHVVVIFQENRSVDNLFHDQVLMNRGAEIASSGKDSHGNLIALGQIDLANDYDLSHAHSAFVSMYDNGNMDGADLIPIHCNTGAVNCPPANPQFMYVNPSELVPYFQLAEQYTFGDHMFQTNQGPSFPAHQFIISGTSAPSATSTTFASENLSGSSTAGCIAPAGTTVATIDALGNEGNPIYPCFEHQTLTDLLDGKGISWRYYAPSPGSIWTAPDAIQHMCQPQTQNGQLVCTGSAWNNVSIPSKQVLTDIANNNLAQVTWVIPGGGESDHPGSNDGSGPSWVASIINAIGGSPYWKDTAIIITWDDWGGWYDHIAPKVVNDGTSWGSGYVYGFRVPLIVVSPYAKPAYISKATHDFGSILKFVEGVYGLGSLGYADAPADDLSDCFNFNQTPLQFKAIQAAVSAEHFIKDTRPPTDPDDD